MNNAAAPARNVKIIYVKEIDHPKFILWRKSDLIKQREQSSRASILFNAGTAMALSAALTLAALKLLCY